MKRTSRNKGFTLIELIITVAILALVVAPFLGSFVTAGNINVNAKKKQVGTTYAEYLSERFKAKKLDTLKEDYDNTADGRYTYDAVNKSYSFDIKGRPQGVNSNYTAKVELTKAASNINTDDVVPILQNIKKDTTFMALGDFFSNDGLYADATKRDSEINITYDASKSVSQKYGVQLIVRYYKGGVLMGSDIELSSRRYPKIPEVYLLYVALGDNDTITINNAIKPSDVHSLDKDGNESDRINIHVIGQESSSLTKHLSPINVSFNSTRENGTPCPTARLSTLLTNGSAEGLDNISVFTNLKQSGIDGKVLDRSKDTELYDMTIDILYKGSTLTTVKTSKNREG